MADQFAVRRAAEQKMPLKLQAHLVDKPWGRTDLTSVFNGSPGRKIGEIWFEDPEQGDLPLLVKYIFTSEKLSIQVHPNDQQAGEHGLQRGKNECWYILDAKPGATVGLGLNERATAEVLKQAALDGSIEDLLNWHPVKPGDFFYVPAGTVHAIGAGIMLLELQQNSDVTYRLYDYGRPRELHLLDGIAVATLDEYNAFNSRPAGDPIDTVLVDGPHFSLIRATSRDRIAPSLESRLRWVMPLQGRATANGDAATIGECLLLDEGVELSLADSTVVLIGVEGSVLQ